MKKSESTTIEAKWGRLGIHFFAAPVPRTPDVELLLVQTGEGISENARLLPHVVGWLLVYSDFVVKHRLKELIVRRASAEERAGLGLVLEIALLHGAPKDLSIPLAVCTPIRPERPLHDFQRANAIFTSIAEETASVVSRKWGLWSPEIEPRFDAIRPVSWLLGQNPALRSRIVRKGDLRASILEVLRLDVAGEVESAAELGRLTGATRAAVGAALKALVLEGEVKIVPHATNKRDHRVVLLPAA
ncbi:MAG: hypothetical protein JNK16_01095 [Phycisphaerales bacterium]|nr:hypothetical protein [Phycisphaerales bacterium]